MSQRTVVSNININNSSAHNFILNDKDQDSINIKSSSNHNNISDHYISKKLSIKLIQNDGQISQNQYLSSFNTIQKTNNSNYHIQSSNNTVQSVKNSQQNVQNDQQCAQISDNKSYQDEQKELQNESSSSSVNQSIIKTCLQKQTSINIEVLKSNSIDFLDMKNPLHQQIIINILLKNRQKNQNEGEVLYQVISNLPFFKNHKELLSLTSTSKELLSSLKLEYYSQYDTLFSKDEMIQNYQSLDQRLQMEIVLFEKYLFYKKGDIGNTFYIIIQGSAYCLLGDSVDAKKQQELKQKMKEEQSKKKQGSFYIDIKSNPSFETEQSQLKLIYPTLNLVKIYTPGESFGEIALITSQPRTATFILREDTYFITLSKDAYGKIMGSYEQNILRDRRKFLMSFCCFKYHTYSKLLSLLHFMKILQVPKKYVIYKEGDIADTIYFVKKGEVEISKTIDLDELIEQDNSIELQEWRNIRKTQLYKLNKIKQFKDKVESILKVQVVILSENNCFGEEDIFLDSQYRTSTAIVISSQAEIFAIDKSKLFNDLGNHQTLDSFEEEFKLKYQQQQVAFEKNINTSLALRKSQIINIKPQQLIKSSANQFLLSPSSQSQLQLQQQSPNLQLFSKLSSSTKTPNLVQQTFGYSSYRDNVNSDQNNHHHIQIQSLQPPIFNQPQSYLHTQQQQQQYLFKQQQIQQEQYQQQNKQQSQALQKNYFQIRHAQINHGFPYFKSSLGDVSKICKTNPNENSTILSIGESKSHQFITHNEKGQIHKNIKTEINNNSHYFEKEKKMIFFNPTNHHSLITQLSSNRENNYFSRLNNNSSNNFQNINNSHNNNSNNNSQNNNNPFQDDKQEQKIQKKKKNYYKNQKIIFRTIRKEEEKKDDVMTQLNNIDEIYYQNQLKLVDLNTRSLDLNEISNELLKVYMHKHSQQQVQQSLENITASRLLSMSSTLRKGRNHQSRFLLSSKPHFLQTQNNSSNNPSTPKSKSQTNENISNPLLKSDFIEESLPIQQSPVISIIKRRPKNLSVVIPTNSLTQRNNNISECLKPIGFKMNTPTTTTNSNTTNYFDKYSNEQNITLPSSINRNKSNPNSDNSKNNNKKNINNNNLLDKNQKINQSNHKKNYSSNNNTISNNTNNNFNTSNNTNNNQYYPMTTTMQYQYFKKQVDFLENSEKYIEQIKKSSGNILKLNEMLNSNQIPEQSSPLSSNKMNRRQTQQAFNHSISFLAEQIFKGSASSIKNIKLQRHHSVIMQAGISSSSDFNHTNSSQFNSEKKKLSVIIDNDKSNILSNHHQIHLHNKNDHQKYKPSFSLQKLFSQKTYQLKSEETEDEEELKQMEDSINEEDLQNLPLIKNLKNQNLHQTQSLDISRKQSLFSRNNNDSFLIKLRQQSQDAQPQPHQYLISSSSISPKNQKQLNSDENNRNHQKLNNSNSFKSQSSPRQNTSSSQFKIETGYQQSSHFKTQSSTTPLQFPSNNQKQQKDNNIGLSFKNIIQIPTTISDESDKSDIILLKQLKQNSNPVLSKILSQIQDMKKEKKEEFHSFLGKSLNTQNLNNNINKDSSNQFYHSFNSYDLPQENSFKKYKSNINNLKGDQQFYQKIIDSNNQQKALFKSAKLSNINNHSKSNNKSLTNPIIISDCLQIQQKQQIKKQNNTHHS